jgi:RNA-binding protein
VLHVSSSKNLILKAEKIPRINDEVVDENLKSVGVVFDVFGPVSSPYVAVKPSVEEPQRFVNRFLYVFPSPKRKWKKRK